SGASLSSSVVISNTFIQNKYINSIYIKTSQISEPVRFVLEHYQDYEFLLIQNFHIEIHSCIRRNDSTCSLCPITQIGRNNPKYFRAFFKQSQSFHPTSD